MRLCFAAVLPAVVVGCGVCGGCGCSIAAAAAVAVAVVVVAVAVAVVVVVVVDVVVAVAVAVPHPNLFATHAIDVTFAAASYKRGGRRKKTAVFTADSQK